MKHTWMRWAGFAVMAGLAGCTDESTDVAAVTDVGATDGTDAADAADGSEDTPAPHVDFAPGVPEKPEDLCTDDAGSICTWAGTGDAGFNGDGYPLQASFLYWPIDLTFTKAGQTYVLDWNNHAVREVVDGAFKTVIGDGFVGDGPPGAADQTEPGVNGDTVSLNHPTQMIELPDGRLLLSSWHNHKIRRYDPANGNVYVVVGSAPGYYGDGGPAKKARMNQPVSIAMRSDGGFYILDQRNQDIRMVDKDGGMRSVAGKRVTTDAEGKPLPLPKGGYNEDGLTPLETQFNQPSGSNPTPGGTLAVAEDGAVYIADQLNHRIRKITFEDAANPDGTKGTVETIAGSEKGFADGAGADAKFDTPRKIAFGPDGLLYVADRGNNRIRAIDLATKTVTTVAGGATGGYAGDGGAATDAQLNHPNGFAFNDNYLYIADTDNHRVRRVTLAK